MPDLAAPATLSVWYADLAEQVLEGERIVEVLIDGATFEIVSPASGRLVRKNVLAREPASPGQVLGLIQLAGTRLPALP